MARWKFWGVIRELVMLDERNERNRLVEEFSSEYFLTLRNLQDKCLNYELSLFISDWITWFFIVPTTNFNNIHTSPLSYTYDMLKSA